jgi:hypothetical protein
VNKNSTKPTALRAPVGTTAVDSIESIEHFFAQIMPSGATTMSWPEVEASFQVAQKLVDFQQRAKNLFKEIEGDLGVDRAKYIFGTLVTTSGPSRSMRRVEKSNNILLLSLYIDHRLPVQQFARRLVNGNGYEKHLGPFGVPYRKTTAEAIEQQLKRLLKKDPAKEDSTMMRVLLADARRVHQELAVKPGRPRLRK